MKNIVGIFSNTMKDTSTTINLIVGRDAHD